MRHEYPNCKYCPKRLKVNGEYIGPVYVIGLIKEKIKPWSNLDRQLSHLIAEDKDRYVSNNCLVDWKWMGKKSDLKPETQQYIKAICQSTVTRICEKRKEPYKSGATWETIRRDLWRNAVTEIDASEFDDAVLLKKL